MSAPATPDPRNDPRLDEFRSLPISVKARALGDLATELRGYADRWEAENRLRVIDNDTVDAVAGCLYAIGTQQMGRLAPGRSAWTQMSEKSKARTGYRATARALLEHFDIRPKATLAGDEDDTPGTTKNRSTR